MNTLINNSEPMLKYIYMLIAPVSLWPLFSFLFICSGYLFGSPDEFMLIQYGPKWRLLDEFFTYWIASLPVFYAIFGICFIFTKMLNHFNLNALTVIVLISILSAYISHVFFQGNIMAVLVISICIIYIELIFIYLQFGFKSLNSENRE